MAMFNSYVSLPEGIASGNQTWQEWKSSQQQFDDFPAKDLHGMARDFPAARHVSEPGKEENLNIGSQMLGMDLAIGKEFTRLLQATTWEVKRIPYWSSSSIPKTS